MTVGGIKAGWKNTTKATGFYMLPTVGNQTDEGRTHLNRPAPPEAGEHQPRAAQRPAPLRALPRTPGAMREVLPGLGLFGASSRSPTNF